MSLYIKLCGLALMLIASLGIVKSYREHNARRISETEGFILLLSHLEGRISRYLMPVADALRDFSDKKLDGTGFLREVAEGGKVDSAFAKTVPHLAIGDGAKEILVGLFSGLGSGYRDEVLGEIRESRSRLTAILEDERDSLQKNESVVSAITVAVTLGVFILLV